MPQPFLDSGNVGLVGERVGRGCCAHRVDADADGLAADAGERGVFHDDIAVNGAGIEMPLQCAGAVVRDGAEEGSIQVAQIQFRIACFQCGKIFGNQALRAGLNGNITVKPKSRIEED